jgi:heptosyltransferase-2
MDHFRTGLFKSKRSKSAGQISKVSETLIVQTAFLGDVILAIGLIRAFASKSHVTVVVRSGVGDILSWISNVTVVEIKKGSQKSYQDALRHLRQKTFDITICLHQSFRSAIFVSQIRSNIKVGYNKNCFTNWVYDFLIHRQLNWPEPMRVFQCLTPFRSLFPDEIKKIEQGGFESLNLKDSNSLLPKLPEGFGFQVSNIENRPKRVAFFHGSQWGTKKWPIEYFIKLGSWFELQGFEVAWLGTTAEGLELEARLPKSSHSQILAGKMNLSQSLKFLLSCQIVVSNDSGGGHMGALAGCKIVSIFGPTHISYGYRPWANEVMILEHDQLDCRPCHHHGPNTCPLGHHKCMKDITVDMLVERLTCFL